MYFDKDRGEHVEQKILTPEEMARYGTAAESLGLSFTVLAKGTDTETRIGAGQTYADYADSVNAWRDELFEAAVGDAYISYMDSEEHRWEADQSLGAGSVLVELAAPDIEPLRQLPDEMRRLQLSGE